MIIMKLIIFYFTKCILLINMIRFKVFTFIHCITIKSFVIGVLLNSLLILHTYIYILDQ